MLLTEIDKKENFVSSEGCGCCSTRFYFQPPWYEDDEEDFWSYNQKLTKEILQQGIEEMEAILEQLKSLMEKLPE